MKVLKVILIILLVLAILAGLGFAGWKFVYPLFFDSARGYTLANNAYGEMQIIRYEGDAKKLTLPSEHEGKVVAEIDSFAFETETLREVTISASVTKLHLDPFMKCPALEKIHVAQDNPEMTSVDGVLFSKDGKTLLSYPRGRQGSYDVPEGVETIAPFAFAKATALTGVTFPASVHTVGMSAFQSCTGLDSVVLPATISQIGENAFQIYGGIELHVEEGSAAEEYGLQMGFRVQLMENAAE